MIPRSQLAHGWQYISLRRRASELRLLPISLQVVASLWCERHVGWVCRKIPIVVEECAEAQIRPDVALCRWNFAELD
jgi:hypothetical protein